MMKMKTKCSVLLLALICATLGIGGCTDYYAAYPGYGPYYGPGPYYAGYPGSVTVAVGDRPYYRGPGYWSGRVYYVWRPGHWRWRHGVRVWVPGHYVVRRY
ncbi:MAG: hypothetical protein DME76_03550 [Verrucomicrobia bacterium]|nr:MAG: hypothetical protein DME76_03550 [Verrucomicrobiota bacterium]